MKTTISLGREIKISILFFLLILGNSTILFPQEEFICATPEYNSSELSGNFIHITDSTYFENTESLVFNVFFWGINEDNGYSSNKLTIIDALHATAELNKKYNQFNIFFKYFGYDYINSSQFYTIYVNCNDPNDVNSDSCLYGDLPLFLHQNPEYVNTNAINIYIPKSTVGFGGAGFYQDLRIVINSYSFENDNSRLINHEMGHVFRLGHTHGGWTASEPWCEHVTRDINDIDDPNDPNDTYYNADVRGDAVHDTAAVPDFRNEGCEEAGYSYPYTNCPESLRFLYISDAPDCNYDNINGMDCQGTPYQIFTEDVRNLMAYTYSDCGQDFTLDQGAKIRENIGDSPTRYNPVKNILGLESLYQPYKGTYSTDGRIVGPDIPPTFQPGFDYEFVSCGPYGEYPPPPIYSDTSFWYINGGLFNYMFFKDIPREQYNNIIHKNNFAIRIAQVINLHPERNCYSVSGNASEGSVTKFEDNIFNNNITVTSKDSTEINSPTLINTLNPGLYKIEKVYPDGIIEEVVILKQNNMPNP